LSKAEYLVSAGIAAGALLLLVSEAAVSQDHAISVFSSDTIKWGPAPFTIRLKVPAGYKIAAHNHPTYEAVTFISGNSNPEWEINSMRPKPKSCLLAVSSISRPT